jgi:hypothetical protein
VETIITDAKSRVSIGSRLLWFVGIWAVSVVFVAGVAEGLKIILG